MAELPASPQRPPRPPRTFPLRLSLLLLTLSLFGCDHATKSAAHASLASGKAIDLVSGILELRFRPNDDTAFGLLRTFGVARTPGLLLAASGLALVALAAMWVASRKRATRTQHVGFALVLSGALGNVVDRLVRGYVVDFIHLTRWPVFNVADMAVVAGAILLAVSALARNRKTTEPAPS